MLTLLVSCGPAAAAVVAAAPAQPASGSYSVTVSTDRPEYTLGENVLVHFKLQNTGAAPFTINYGGDYRGAPRAMRFIVTATPVAGGRAALDPYPAAQNFGGLGGDREIKPGEAFASSIPLMRHAHVAVPGEYVIRVGHDLGWNGPPPPRPPPPAEQPGAVAETRVRFVMPDERRAADVMAASLARVDRDYPNMGQRAEEFGDLSVMRYPVYLPMLEKQLSFQPLGDARQRNRPAEQALEAIARMPDPTAVATLLRLSEGKSGEAAGQLARAMLNHLPKSADDKKHGPPQRFPADLSWREEFAPDVRKLAARMLAMEAPENVAWGGTLLSHVGTPEDLPIVIATMDRVLPTLAAARYEQGIFARPRDTMASLQKCVRELVARGARRPSDPKTPGEIVALLSDLHDEPRPAELAAQTTEWTQHPMRYVRELAVRAAPLPLDERVRDRLPALIEDEDVNVRLAAAHTAQRAKAASANPALLRRLAKAETTWEIDMMAAALKETGGAVDAWHAMAARLDAVKLTNTLLKHLSEVVNHSGGFSWRDEVSIAEAARVKARWQAFLTEHDASLRGGKRFTVGDAAFPPELYTPDFKLNSPDGDWPPARAGN